MDRKIYAKSLLDRFLSSRRFCVSSAPLRWRQFVLIILGITVACLVFLLDDPAGVPPAHAEVAAFQSAVWQRDRSKPSSWIFAEHGGQIEFGPVTVVVPPWFTKQGGANVFGDIVADSGIDEPLQLVPGTEFAFGIWPSQVQTKFEQPIQFRISLNAALFVDGNFDDLTFMMYDPDTARWLELPAEFSVATYQVVALVQEFKPVPSDFPNWGGRTFFGLFQSDGESVPTAVTPASIGSSEPFVNRDVNLRRGPGTNYPIVRQAPRGTAVKPVARTRDNGWLALEDGTWIAAWLVDNTPVLPVASITPTPPPTPTRIPIPQSTPTGSAPGPSASTATPRSPRADAPEKTPEVKRSASLSLEDGLLVDFDDVDPGKPTDVDLIVQIGPDETGLLTLLNGARIGNSGSVRTDYTTCTDLDHSDDELELDTGQLITNICLQTSDGQIVSGRVIRRVAQGNEMVLRYYLWE